MGNSMHSILYLLQNGYYLLYLEIIIFELIVKARNKVISDQVVPT